MVVCVVQRQGGVGIGEVARGILPVRVVVGVGYDSEVAHFVDQRTGLRIGADQRCGPERVADPDLVRLILEHVGVIVFVAAAVDGDLAAGLVHCSVYRREVLLRGGVARIDVGTEPGAVARTVGVGVEIALSLLAVGARRKHRITEDVLLGRGAAGIAHADHIRQPRIGRQHRAETAAAGQSGRLVQHHLDRRALRDHRQTIALLQTDAAGQRCVLQRRRVGDGVMTRFRQIIGSAQGDSAAIAAAGADDREIIGGRHAAFDHRAFETDFQTVAGDAEQIGAVYFRRQLPFRNAQRFAAGIGERDFHVVVAQRAHADAQRVE